MEFDYIIFGAGSAKCVLANRTTIAEGNKVLLLDARPKNTTGLSIWPVFESIS